MKPVFCAEILSALKKSVHVVNSIINNGVDKSTCLTTQVHLHHAWGITLQHPGQLEYHTNTVHKYNLSMVLTQVHCSSTSTLYSGPKLPALLDQNFAGYLCLCLIDAHRKTSYFNSTKYLWILDKLSNSKLYVKMTHMTTNDPRSSKTGSAWSWH